MYALGTASKKKLATTHRDMQAVVELAITLTDVDFSFVEGERSLKQQIKNVKNGVSWTLESKHLPNDDGDVLAGDIYPWVDGKTSMDREHFKRVAKAMFNAAQGLGIHIEWGGFFPKEQEDMPHWELKS